MTASQQWQEPPDGGEFRTENYRRLVNISFFIKAYQGEGGGGILIRMCLKKKQHC